MMASHFLEHSLPVGGGLALLAALSRDYGGGAILVDRFRYQTLNNGSFPSLNLTHKEAVNVLNGINVMYIDKSVRKSEHLKTEKELNENEVDAQQVGQPQKGSNPTLDRINLESWGGASKNPRKPEGNPIWVVLSSGNSSPPVSQLVGVEKKNGSEKGKRVKNNTVKVEEKLREVVHVRAKRGQATDSHSLAERV
uniref:Uncharacterized protein n=1 Tax=Cannabis sativa TaxID=3483 RepID=A0A803P4Z9_CANSA